MYTVKRVKSNIRPAIVQLGEDKHRLNTTPYPYKHPYTTYFLAQSQAKTPATPLFSSRMPTFVTMKQEKETNSPILHLQQQQLLLRMEYEYEKEEFKRQTETMGVARKVKRGLCWFHASA